MLSLGGQGIESTKITLSTIRRNLLIKWHNCVLISVKVTDQRKAMLLDNSYLEFGWLLPMCIR